MITDEQIDELIKVLQYELGWEPDHNLGNEEEYKIVNKWLESILAAERNRLLAECLDCITTQWDDIENTRDVERIIEALRHE